MPSWGPSCENEEGFTVNWTGLEAFAGHDVHGVLDPVDEFADALVNRIGPFEETIGDDGEATHKVEYGGNLANWAFYYFVDGNDNGVCDPENPADIKGTHALEMDLTEITIGHLAGVESPTGVCPHFDPKEESSDEADDSDDAALEIPGALLTLSWTDLEVPPHTVIFIKLVDEDGWKIGPYEAGVDDRGVYAAVGINEGRGYVPEVKWTLFSWMDTNGNQMCEEDLDTLTVHDLPLGAKSFAMAYDGTTQPTGLCEQVSGFFGVYQPPPNTP